MQKIRLGLFGSGIEMSQAPRLHKIAGKLSTLDVSYDLFDLAELDSATFERGLRDVIAEGFDGVNVTHPFKEHAPQLVKIPNKNSQRIGAINTIRFADQTGFNTDYSGFIKAFQFTFGTISPGNVLLVGAGGVGRAISFALGQLDAKASLKIVDSDLKKAQALVRDLRLAGFIANAHKLTELSDISNVEGLINCTPLGMQQHPGSAIPKQILSGKTWAFDAVYTPIETEFLLNAKKANLEILSGYELFFYQGLDAFEIFTGQRVDESELRKALAKS